MSSGSSSDKEIPLPPLIPREGSEDRSDKSFKDDSEHGDKPMKMDGNIAGYVPAQRLEWKRYKQYTRNDIMAAIEEVRKGKIRNIGDSLIVCNSLSQQFLPSKHKTGLNSTKNIMNKSLRVAFI